MFLTFVIISRYKFTVRLFADHENLYVLYELLLLWHFRIFSFSKLHLRCMPFCSHHGSYFEPIVFKSLPKKPVSSLGIGRDAGDLRDW